MKKIFFILLMTLLGCLATGVLADCPDGLSFDVNTKICTNSDKSITAVPAPCPKDYPFYEDGYCCDIKMQKYTTPHESSSTQEYPERETW